MQSNILKTQKSSTETQTSQVSGAGDRERLQMAFGKPPASVHRITGPQNVQAGTLGLHS